MNNQNAPLRSLLPKFNETIIKIIAPFRICRMGFYIVMKVIFQSQ